MTAKTVDEIILDELRELRRWSMWQTALLSAIAGLLGLRLVVPGA